MNISKRANVIRVTMSTAKARKIMNTVLGPCADYAADPLLQDVYLRGVRDVLGKGLGFEFRRAVLSGDMRRVARFCSDGWRVLPNDAGSSPAASARKTNSTERKERQTMSEQNNENDNIEQDVFAEVLKTAFAALYGDTATRRLAAGDIIHALASAYPGVGAAKGQHGDAPARSEEPTGWDRFLTVAPGLKLQRFGAPGQPTLYVGKRVLPDQTKNPAQVFELIVRRGGFVEAYEGELPLFNFECRGAQWKREYLAVKALKALLAARRKDHARNRRRRKNRAARAAAEKAGCPF